MTLTDLHVYTTRAIATQSTGLYVALINYYAYNELWLEI